jgi:hypothetical protein
MIFPGLFRGPGYCITVVLAGGQAWYSGKDYRKDMKKDMCLMAAWQSHAAIKHISFFFEIHKRASVIL